MRSPSSLLWLGLLASCRAWHPDSGQTTSCDPRELEPGEVRARRMPCDDEGISGGEGRRGDTLIENAWARFVIRHAGAPLTLTSGGGGTIIDAAEPGGSDALSELVPLLAGGWLREVELELEQDAHEARVTVSGLPDPISFLESSGAGDERVAVVYRLGAHDRALGIEDADGFWLLPRAGFELAGPVLHAGALALAMDQAPEDRGGGLLYTGGGLFATGSPSLVQAALWPGGEDASGVCAGEGVEVLEGAEVVGRLLVDEDGSFAGSLPAGADGVRAVGSGYTPGPMASPGEDLDLALGAEARLGVRIADPQGAELPGLLLATGEDGREQRHAVPAEGLWVALGPGVWDLTLASGPLRSRVQRSSVDLQADERFEVLLAGMDDPEGWLLADLDVEVWPSRDERREPSELLGLAAAGGVDFAVATAPDEVAEAALEQPWDALLLAQSGSRADTEQVGSVIAWPWSSNTRKPAHSAVDWQGLSAEDLLVLASGGSGKGRLMVVDEDWIQAAGPAMDWEPRPDALLLEDPDQLPALLELYDSWVDLAAVGPLTWIQVEDDGQRAVVDVERGLVEAHTVATSGPFIELLADGAWPGDLLLHPGPHRVHVVVRAPDWVELEGAALVVDGERLVSWDLAGAKGDPRLEEELLVLGSRYLLALAWGSVDPGPPAPGPQWAVTSPIWLGSP